MDRSTEIGDRIVRIGLLERPEVHQATGMVLVQLGISPTDALARLRTYARMTKQPTSAIAELVIDRSLHFGADGPTMR